MSKEYDSYIRKHKDDVILSWAMLQNACNIEKWATQTDIDKANSLIHRHDDSKYMFDEYEAYDAYFYGNDHSYNVTNEFNKAFLFHLHRNPHHWQYWVLPKDSPDDEEIIFEMPIPYVFEMICDWWSFSWKNNYPLEIVSWYEDRRDFIKLHYQTRIVVEDILKTISDKFA